MTTTYRKKLIEVALPLAVVNDACHEDKNRKTGHIRNIHKWFAPMPLPAWRAIIAATIFDDPGSVPEERHPELRRAELLHLIERAASLDAPGEAVAELRKAIAESTTDSSPVIWDPFCGGGSTIVEAQRLGLSVCGSDLNPIPVVISTALTVIPQLVRDRRPVFPGTARGRTHWAGLDGFTADVSAYADVIRERALKKLEHLYPEGPDGTRIFAWRWTWTVPSPDPARAGAMVPLTSDFRLAKVGTEQVWVEPVATADRRSYRFEVRRGRPTQDIASGTKRGRGASFQCILSGAPIEDSYVKAQARAGKIALRLMAAVGFRAQERVFIDPTESLERIGLTALKPEFAEFLHYPMPENPRWFSPPEFGLATYDRLFTPRQITSVGTFAFLVDSMREEIMADAVGAGWNATDERPLYQGGKGATAYCDAVMTVLGLAVGRLAQSNNALVRWFVDPRSGGGKATPSFDRHAIPMVWDFTETSPFGGSVGDWTGPVLQTVLRAFPLVSKCDAPGTVSQADATRPAVPTRAILLTDPPYYDNIGYAALSDFFYLVERPALRRVFPEVFTTVMTPKAAELIADRYRHNGSSAEAEAFFYDGFVRFLRAARSQLLPEYPIAIIYALKQSELGPTKSSGWEVFLQSLLDAGLQITATWPIRTTTPTRMIGLGTNALASAICVVCRPTPEKREEIGRVELRRLLRSELPPALRILHASNIAPVDLEQASIGPGMAVFSRFARVREADGSVLSVRAVLQLINEALDEYLAESEGELDPDTRFAITWYEQHGWDDGPFGDAENIARARNVSVKGVAEAGICKSGGGKVRILKRAEMRPTDYDPATDKTPTVWEFTQHLIRNLEDEGEEAAARLLNKLGARAGSAKELAYRLYNTCERKKWAEDARSYNGLIVAWPELEKLAAKVGDETAAEPVGKPGKKGAKKKSVKGQKDLFGGDDE